MKSILPIIAILLSGLYSCNCYKSISGITVNQTDGGLQLVKYEKEKIFISYYGDYWFHRPTRQSTLNWNKDFAKSINEIKDRKILYAAHTIMEPYCSTIGLIYKHSRIDTLVKIVADNLRKKFKAENLKTTTELIGTNSYIKLSYDLKNPELKVKSKYLEYYSVCNENILRVVFWTMETHMDDWFNSETKDIIETIKSDI